MPTKKIPSFSTFLIDTVDENFKEDDYTKAKNWVDTLNLDIRTPKGMKKEHDLLKYLSKQIESVELYYKGVPDEGYTYEINRIMNDDFSKQDIEKISVKFGKNDEQPLEIKKKYATYIKSDASKYEKFIIAIDELETLLSKLKGFHKKPLKKLVIRFVKKTELRGKALYKTSKDELWLNLQSPLKSDGYGSLKYITIHELGHRYLTKVKKQKWNYDSWDWVTTKYSQVDSLSGEEKFAELFAITHWYNDYKEHKEVMDKFVNTIE